MLIVEKVKQSQSLKLQNENEISGASQELVVVTDLYMFPLNIEMPLYTADTQT